MWKKVFADVIKLEGLEMRLSRWALNEITNILNKRKITHRKGESSTTSEAEIGVMQPQVKECHRHWIIPQRFRRIEDPANTLILAYKLILDFSPSEL